MDKIVDIQSYDYLIGIITDKVYSYTSQYVYSGQTFKSANIAINGTYGYAVGPTGTAGRINYDFGTTTTVNIPITLTVSNSYTPPTKEKIKNDLVKFLNAVNIPTGTDKPTISGLLSFICAISFFVSKAVIKQAIKSEDSSNTYSYHYKSPDSSEYAKLPYDYSNDGIIYTNKINDIYTQLINTSLVSDNSSSCSSSSCSSSSCSSSSCSSSSFIIYLV